MGAGKVAPAPLMSIWAAGAAGGGVVASAGAEASLGAQPARRARAAETKKRFFMGEAMEAGEDRKRGAAGHPMPWATGGGDGGGIRTSRSDRAGRASIGRGRYRDSWCPANRRP